MSKPNNNLVSSYSVDIRSPIFWRITAVVFASILIIEAALLLVSWFTERDRLLSRLDDSLATMTSLLDFDNARNQLDSLIQLKESDSKHQIIGYAYQHASGAAYVGGQHNLLETEVNAQNPTRYLSTNGTYSTYLERDNPNSGQDKIWLRVDTRWIKAYMQNYVWRIVGMVLLISAFVTGACLIFINPLLIKPLQRLNKSLIKSETHGIRTAVSASRDLTRKDELGSVFRSFDHLRNELIVAEDDKSFVTDRFEEFASLGADCFWEVNSDDICTYVAGDVCRLLSMSPEDIIGKNYRAVIDALSPRIPDIESLNTALLESGVWEGKITSNTPNQTTYSIRVTATIFRDSLSKYAGVRGTIIDISKEAQLSEELHYQATHDPLTGLCNRRELSNQIHQKIEEFKNQGKVFTLLTLDLDRFKSINDSCGHIAGDNLLKALASNMVTCVDDSDTVARIGGDEFSILVDSSRQDRAQSIAEKVRRIIEEYKLVWEGKSHSVSVSIGLAQVDTELATHEAMMYASDSCCIAAKNRGKNQIVAYASDDDSVAVFNNEALWISRIYQGLEDNQFQLFRQNIARIDQAQEEHFEILLRLKNGIDGFWPPNYFLPIAERNGLMPKIDKWVVSTALEWLKLQHISPEQSYCMNINLSAASLGDHSFQEFLLNRVKHNTDLNQYVCFEITESAAMINLEATVDLLQKLRDHGCRIALDDFGTGFSSLSQIRDLPLDFIKIDGTFIQEIHLNELDQAVVRSVADIAKVLRIKTVAEFVDSEAAFNLLESMHIDYAQGFLISKPHALEGSHADDISHKAA